MLCTLVAPYASTRGRDSKTGGNVMYPVAGRQFSRVFVQPANPNTVYQQAVRENFAAASVAYKSTTPVEREAWKTLADQIVRNDPNGNGYVQTQQGAYLSVNCLRQLDGQTITDTAPAYANQLASTATAIAQAGTSVTITLEAAILQPAGYYLVELSPALPGLALQAREGDCVNPFTVENLDEAIIVVAEGGVTEVVLNATLMRLTLVNGSRYGVKMTALSSGYVKGQTTLATLTATVA